MRKLGFNKFHSKINHSAIQDEFVIIQCSKDDGWLSYHELSDMDALLTNEKCKAISVCFTRGKQAYILYNKSEFQKAKSIKFLDDFKEDFDYRLEKINSNLVDENKLIQLFLNACSNSENPRFRYNNLNGSLFITTPESTFFNKQDLSRIALEVRVMWKNIFRLDTVTFTSLKRYKDLIRDDFGKNSGKRIKKVKNHPRFLFDSKNSTLRRHFGNPDDFSKDLYIKMRPKENFRKGAKKKSQIPFLTTNPSKYSSTKIGMLATLMIEDFNKKFCEYITLEQDIVENEITESYKQKKVLFEGLKNTPVQLLDNVGSANVLNEIIKTSKEKFGINLSVSKTLSKNGINLLFNQDADFYNLNKSTKDPYQKSKLDCAIQNFTLQEFKSKGANQLFKTLLEAQIKFDIVNGQLSIFNWSELDIKKDWYFCTAKLDEEYGDLIFFLLQISTDGQLSFSCFRQGEEESSIERRIVSVFNDYVDKNGKPIIEGVLCDSNNNVNTISKTDLFTMPELFSLHNEVMQGTEVEGVEINKEDLLDFTTHFIEVNGVNERIEKALVEIKSEENDIIFLSKFQAPFKGKGMEKLTKKFVDEFKGKFGYWLKHSVKNKESVNNTFGSMVDLHAVKDRQKVLFWANKNMGKTKGEFIKTNVVRSLRIWGNSIPLFNNLLKMMAVDFVRVDAPSVIPFPFKFLREYEKMAVIPEPKEIDLEGFNLNV